MIVIQIFSTSALPTVNIVVDNTLQIGNSSTITCAINVQGYPPYYTYQWNFYGKDSKSLPEINISSGNQLIINNTQRTHAGVYMCLCHNGAGVVSATTELQVLCKLLIFNQYNK
jgi:hypothetical protein